MPNHAQHVHFFPKRPTSYSKIHSQPIDKDFFQAVELSCKQFNVQFWNNNKALRQFNKISLTKQVDFLRGLGFRTTLKSLSEGETNKRYLFSVFYLAAISHFWGKSLTVMLYGNPLEGIQ